MTKPPDILWIVTTQWRASATGYAGDANARTPALDALAAKGVNYTQAVTPHPFGPFARAALLTGVPSPENGVRDYFDPLPTGSRTIAHEMSDRGYVTAFFGNWQLGRRDPAAPLVGVAHAATIVPSAGRGGFEFWEGFESGFLLNDPWLQGTRLPAPVQMRGYQSEVLGERAGKWIGESESPFGGRSQLSDRSWFCVVSMEAPHPPYGADAGGIPPRAAADIVVERNVPRGGEVEARARRELAGYYAHIEATDGAIGRLVAAARRASPECVVLFTSVHGDMHGAHGLFRKGWPHEESVRVPMVVSGAPGGGAKGSVNDDAVSLVDLPAMTCAWAEGRAWHGVREHAVISMPGVVALPLQCDRSWCGLRSKERKLVLDERGEPWLFFDLKRDPLELDNWVGDPAHAAEIAAWRAAVLG